MTEEQENGSLAAPTQVATTEPASAEPAPAAAILPIAADPPTVDPGLRAELLRQFEQWLDETLAAESPPRGIPEDLLESPSAADAQPAADSDTDLYSLFSALTALTGEIRLQGRAFKQLTDVLAPLADAAPALRELPDLQRESTQSIAAAIDQLASDGDELTIPGHQVCQTLIDLYDRLDRGLQTCRQGIATIQSAQPRGVFWRLAGGPAFASLAAASAQALGDASGLMLARLQSAMQDWGIERIGGVGAPFDPRRMTVVDVRSAGDAEPGTVVEVLRSGYAIHGHIHSAARVAVAAPPKGAEAKQ